MAVFIAAIVFLFVGNIEAHAQTDRWAYLSESPERLIGLLDLPDIVAGGCGSLHKRATTHAFGAPSRNAPVVGTIYMRDEADDCRLMIEKSDGTREEVPTLESGYELDAAIVYERRGPWFRIRLKDGSAWIQHNEPKDFLSYPELLRENLAHTMQSWDGTLRATPESSGRVTPLSPGWKALLDRQLNIQYLGSRTVASDLWIHIRLAAKGGCGQIYEGVTDVEGWIPAYHTDRTTLAWFSSRGC